MRIVASVAAMQRLAKHWQRTGRRVSLVPTLGYLHAGHLSLIKRARQAVGRRGKVVLSIYVNPTQFGPKEDFSRYPRNLKCDLSLCRATGVDVVFAPSDREMYSVGRESLRSTDLKHAKRPGSNQSRTVSLGLSTYVVEEELSRAMEGASRPGHFRGVATVVAKLFNIVQPHIAVFGAKDYQQALIVRRMVRDLNFAVRILIAPTVREQDGLAMSSRNEYLKGTQRAQAVVLWRSLQGAKRIVRKSTTVPAAALKAQIKRWVENEPAMRLVYVEFFDPETLVPVMRVKRGTHMALAVFAGKTRLIDNARL